MAAAEPAPLQVQPEESKPQLARGILSMRNCLALSAAVMRYARLGCGPPKLLRTWANTHCPAASGSRATSMANRHAATKAIEPSP